MINLSDQDLLTFKPEEREREREEGKEKDRERQREIIVWFSTMEIKSLYQGKPLQAFISYYIM